MVGERIVIVEDEGVVALSLRSRLEAANYAIAGVADCAQSAIALVSSTVPDLVLVDVQLKGNRNGIDLAQEIRDRWKIPIVFLTAYTDSGTLHSAQQSEPFGYLVKPFNGSELCGTIEIALHRSQTQRQLEQLVQERTDALERANAQIRTEVAERQRAEAEAMQALSKERELGELKTRFITTASHEFRTPLSIVLTSAELLERLGVDCPEERRSRYFGKIRDAVRSMTKILSDLLIIGKANAGTLEVVRVEFDLQRFCNSLLSDLSLSQEGRSLVQFKFVGDQRQVKLDPELLTLILNNLISNALKYSRSDGEICVEVVCPIPQKLPLCAQIQVRDQGIGIPPQELKRVFEPFHRAKNVEAIPGTGLGLTIVQQCVERQGGDLAIESKLGVGTIVTVQLPIA